MSTLLSRRELQIRHLTISEIRRILAAIRKADEFRIKVSSAFSEKLIEVLKNPRYDERVLELADIVAFALSIAAMKDDKLQKELDNFLAQTAHDFMRFNAFNPRENEVRGEEKIAVLAASTKAWQLMSRAYGINPMAFYVEYLLRRYQIASKEARALLEKLAQGGSE